MSLADRCARMSPALRRFIALFVIPLVLAASGLAVCLPVLHLYESQEAWRSDARRLLARAERVAEEETELRERGEILAGSPLWSKFYESRSNSSTATSLHADVSTLLTGVQASVQSITSVAAQEQPSFARIGVRFTASMRIDQLETFLTRLSAHSRYLRLARVSIVAPQSQRADENPPLAVTMEIHAYEIEARETAQTRAPTLGAVRGGG